MSVYALIMLLYSIPWCLCYKFVHQEWEWVFGSFGYTSNIGPTYIGINLPFLIQIILYNCLGFLHFFITSPMLGLSNLSLKVISYNRIQNHNREELFELFPNGCVLGLCVLWLSFFVSGSLSPLLGLTFQLDLSNLNLSFYLCLFLHTYADYPNKNCIHIHLFIVAIA